MVGRRLLQIKLLLLNQLLSHAMIKEIKSCNHQSRHNGSKYVRWRDKKQILKGNSRHTIQIYGSQNKLLSFCTLKIIKIHISESQIAELLPSLQSSVAANLSCREVERKVFWGLLNGPCLAVCMTIPSTRSP
jgi:hypothetical protein